MNYKHGTVSNFAEKIKGKKNVYCFGAGKALTNFLSEYRQYHIEDSIKYIADNSSKKQGTFAKYLDRSIPVISPEKMLRTISADDIILITVQKFYEITQQLESYSELAAADCYICRFLKMEQNDFERDRIHVPKDLSTQPEICIPKVIHYCWFGKGRIPEQNRRWMESWKRYCPDYQIIEWNESNYDILRNLYMKQAYEKEKWAFVSDYARVDIIAQYGGVYLDTDVELTRNIDVLLKNEAFCGFQNKSEVNFGLGFGAVKNHAAMKKLLDVYENLRFLLDHGRLNLTPCPVYQTDLLVQYGLVQNGEFQKLKGITVYPERVLNGMSAYSRKITEKTGDMYAVHHYSASWTDKSKQEIKQKTAEWGRKHGYNIYTGI